MRIFDKMYNTISFLRKIRLLLPLLIIIFLISLLLGIFIAQLRLGCWIFMTFYLIFVLFLFIPWFFFFKKEKLSDQEFFDNILTEIKTYTMDFKLKHISKALKLDNISTISRILFYLAVILTIPYIFSLLFSPFRLVCWFLIYFYIIICSFLFTKQKNSYNFKMVLFCFAVLALIPTFYGQAMLSMIPLDFLGDLAENFQGNFEDVGDTWNDLWNGNYFEQMSEDWNIYWEGGQQSQVNWYYFLINDDANQNLSNSMNRLNNPITNIRTYMFYIMDVLNWIVFIIFVACIGGIIANGITLQFDKIPKLLALILYGCLVMTIIYGIWSLFPEFEYRTVWETVGDSWWTLLGQIGLAQLDQKGHSIITPRTVVNGIYSLIPLITIIFLFYFSFYFRKSDFKSIMFSRNFLKEDLIVVKKTELSPPVASLILILGFFLTGYFLMTTDPRIVFEGSIIIVFYLFSVIILFLIGFEFLVLKGFASIKSGCFNLIKWTVFGLGALFWWFCVIQPYAFQLGLLPKKTGLITLSQESLYADTFIEQLFLVALPETLIFQIFPIGLGNRLYFYLRKTRIQERQEEKWDMERLKLTDQIARIKFTNSASKNNLRNVAKKALLDQKLKKIERKIDKGRISKIPYIYFILPTMISSVIGSFFFSWYHSFRRGFKGVEGFLAWWGNPMLGLVYFGAGFILCIVAFFCYPASILIHAINNTIAIMTYGGG